MKKEIDMLELQNTETKISTKLLPTIKIHGIGEATKEEIAECIQFITGNQPALISINENAEPDYRKAFVRLKKEEYYTLIRESPIRIMCGLRSLRYEKFISVRTCKLCCCIGDTSEFCKCENIEKEIGEESKSKRKCPNCVLEEYRKNISGGGTTVAKLKKWP